MDSSPVLSTPLSGISLRSRWKFQTLAITPEDVRKKLFYMDEENDDQTHWSSSSEYFSQSLNDASGISGTSQTNMFDEYSPGEQQKPQVNLSSEYVTLSPSPSKRSVAALFSSFTPPPHLKRQRLFSPSSPTNPDKFPIDFQSPVRPSVSPNPYFDSSSDSLNEMAAKGDSSGDTMLSSPPRLERLQLFDYPRTPLSIARSSGLHVQLFSANVEPSFAAVQENGKMPQLHFRHTSKRMNRVKKRTNLHGHVIARRGSRGTNINPFTPLERTRNMLNSSGDRNCANIDTSTPMISKSEMKPHKKLALRESNISRYKEEFHEVCLIGSGSFGTVYKCINRLDGCVYALKRSHKPVVGSGDEPAVLREVCAHAVLGSHQHLVRYYSAWAEDDHMLIQNEFCDGGNLLSRIQLDGNVFGEGELKRLLRHVSMGLQYIHSMGLVHLDIKPDNIFISSVHDSPVSVLPHENFFDEAIADDVLAHRDLDTSQMFVYKIGDMGLVTSVSDPHVEEGDCRYLPRELLQENYSHLCKADVFSLGLTVYQAGSGAELPKNGDEWHRIRDGCLPSLQSCSAAFSELLQVMVHNDPSQRPAASELLSLSIICPSTQKSKAQLCRELNEEKFKNEILQRELRVAREQSSLSVTGSGSHLNGPRLNRSMSIA